ncbi:MAG: tetratricopeptide repeat protein [Phycisphaerales bacterium]|nr:tetratricopeptide repeat protein [Phycisphaerales bacterium]
MKQTLSLLLIASMALLLCSCDLLKPLTNTSLVQTTPSSEEQLALLDQADEASATGNYNEALQLFHQVLQQNPSATEAYIGIGDVYLDQQDYVKAEPVFARAARLEPDNFSAQYGHGVALQMLDRLVDAVRAFHRALTINPSSPEANLQLGTVYLQQRDSKSALNFLARAVELDPSSGPAHLNYAAALQELGSPERAIEQYRAAAELMEPSPELLMNLVTLLAEEKRYREAVNAAQTLVRLDPTAVTYERLGWAYFRLGEYQNSEMAYQEAVTLDPSNYKALNGVGVNSLNHWLRTDRISHEAFLKAQEAFRKSLRVNKNQPKVVQLMMKYGL